MGKPANDSMPAATDPSRPVASWVPPPPVPRSWFEKIALVIAVFIVLGWAGAFVGGFLGFFADRAGPPALEPMFGRPYQVLPADFRVGVDARLRAVAPADWDQQTETQRSAWAREQVELGLVRLDDASLLRHFRLGRAAYRQAPVAVCGAALREGRSGQITLRTGEALVAALSRSQRMEHVEIRLAAIEAQANGSPVPRIVSDAEGERIAAAIKARATPEERMLVDAANGPFASDAELCAGTRALAAATLRLPAEDLATFVRSAYQP